MRAVNLIPGEQRANASVGAGRSGGAAYAVLGLIAAIAVLAVVYGKASRQISSQKNEVATYEAKAQAAQSQAAQLSPYTSFVALHQEREEDVETLVDSRFDWAHAFHEFGRVLNDQTSISSLSGTIDTAAPVAAAAPAPTTAPAATTTTATPAAATTATASSVTSATPPGSVPTFTMSGCATSQDAVAQMLQRLRLIDGVSEVSLQSSAQGGSAGSSGSGSCIGKEAAFSLGVTFDALPAATAAAAAVKGAHATTTSDSSSSTATVAPVQTGGSAR